MKIALTCFLVLLMGSNLIAQDLIITKEKDSINCKITRIKADLIYFTFIYDGEIRNTLIPKSKVSNYTYNHHNYQPETSINQTSSFSDFPRLRIAVSGGSGYRTSKIPNNIPEELSDYINELKNGIQFSFNGHYYFLKNLGFGLNVSRFYASNDLSNVFVRDRFGNLKYGFIKDEIAITFIGPSMSTRFISKNKNNTLSLNLSVGYLGYNNDAVLIDPITILGSTAGVVFDFSYDVGLSEKFAIGLQLSTTLGVLESYEISQNGWKETVRLPPGEYENLARIDFSIGLRFVK